MLRYWLQLAEKSKPGRIWGGLGGLSEAILNDIGSKLACLGSCWCYVAHFGQQDGCQDGILGSKLGASIAILVSFLVPSS